MNCLPKHVMEGNIDGTRRGRRRKQLLDDITKKEEILEEENKSREGELVWSYLAYELPSKTRYGRKYRRDEKRKKT
jgi:hypothetical protein